MYILNKDGNYKNLEYIKSIVEKNCKLKVNSIKLLGSGNDSYVYEVNLEFVFKFPRHKKANLNILKEIDILEFLRDKISFNIPEVVFKGEYTDIDTYIFVGLTKIKGEPLSKEIYHKLNELEKDNLAKELAKFLKELHSFKYDKYKEDNIKKYKQDFVKLKELIYENLEEEVKEKINNMYQKLFLNEDFLNVENALIHNDFSCENILFDLNEKKISGIIDFGDSCVSDIDRDFYYLLEDSDEELGKEFGLKVLEYYGYNNIDRILRKAKFYEKYWTIEQIIYGYEYNYKDWIKEGIENLKSIDFRI